MAPGTTTTRGNHRDDFWADPHFYSTAQDYTLESWHMLPEIIKRIGGAEAFARRLIPSLSAAITGKKSDLHVPWLYHFAGQPQHRHPALRQIADAEVTRCRWLC